MRPKDKKGGLLGLPGGKQMAINVLLVDDSSTMRRLVERTLQAADIQMNEVHHAANGVEALKLLNKYWIDLVLADINMPVMNGIEMIDKMSEDKLLDSIPVVVVSTEGNRERLEHLKTQGIRGRVRKPFTPELLRDVIQNVLELDPRGPIPPSLEPEPYVTIRRVFGEVIEKFTFMITEDISAKLLEAPKSFLIQGKTVFQGGVDGEMVLALGKDTSLEMAANLLALDPNDPLLEKRYEDVLAEVQGILCGNILSALEGIRIVVDLSPVEVCAIDQDQWDCIAEDPETLGFRIEGQNVLLKFVVQRHDGQ